MDRFLMLIDGDWVDSESRDYIEVIQRIMRDNQLQHFETAELSKIAPPVQLAARSAPADEISQIEIGLD